MVGAVGADGKVTVALKSIPPPWDVAPPPWVVSPFPIDPPTEMLPVLWNLKLFCALFSLVLVEVPPPLIVF